MLYVYHISIVFNTLCIYKSWIYIIQFYVFILYKIYNYRSIDNVYLYTYIYLHTLSNKKYYIYTYLNIKYKYK